MASHYCNCDGARYCDVCKKPCHCASRERDMLVQMEPKPNHPGNILHVSIKASTVMRGYVTVKFWYATDCRTDKDYNLEDPVELMQMAVAIKHWIAS